MDVKGYARGEAGLGRREGITARLVNEDASGASVAGRLVALSPTGLTLRVKGGRERTFAAPEVRHVARRGDSLSNGVKWGAALGVGLGCLAGAGFAEHWRWGDCPVGIVFFGPIYLGLAVTVDALHVATTPVYAAPVAPATPDGPQVAVRMTWRW